MRTCPHALLASAFSLLLCTSTSAQTQSTLTLGGDLRIRIQDYRPARFGIGGSDDSIALYRGLLHADWQPSPTVRLFTELGAHAEQGRNGGPGRTDRGALDVQQAYLDLAPERSPLPTTLRLGRQELPYGSGRLLSLRNGPNIRLAYDAARLRLEPGTERIDLLAARPVRNTPGAFDDGSDNGQALWGVYSTLAPPSFKSSKLDLYALTLQRTQVGFASGRADEQRRSLGLRLFGGASGWDWNSEAVWQSGRFGRGEIRAWTLATDTGYQFARARFTPRLALKFDIASGDGDLSDHRLQTFNALYPNAAYFSESSLLAPANLVDLQPTLTVHPHPSTQILLGWDFVWKQRRDDAVYTTPAPLVPVAGTAGGARRIGDQLKLEARFEARPGWILELHLARLRAGPALRQAAGRDVSFVSFTSAWHW